MNIVLIFIALHCALCSGIESYQQVKAIDHYESIKHHDSQVSLRLYRDINDTPLSSLEIVNVRDIYENDLRVAQAIVIATFYYDLSNASPSTPLVPFTKQNNKVYASLLTNDHSKEVISKKYVAEDAVTGDHGIQDGVNNMMEEPLINVIAKIEDNHFHVRGVVLEYRDDLKGSDMLENNFGISAKLPIPAAAAKESGNSKKLNVAGLILILIFMYYFVTSSDAYSQRQPKRAVE